MTVSGKKSASEVKGRSRAIKGLVVVLAVVASLLMVTWTDCGCSEDVEEKQDAPVEVEEQTTDTGTSSVGSSPSQAALDSALQNGKPVFLNFHSNQCIPCIEMEKVIAEVEPEFTGRVEFVVVDVYDPSEMSLCNYFQVSVIPASFFIKPDGTVIDAYEGPINTAQMRELLNNLIAGAV